MSNPYLATASGEPVSGSTAIRASGYLANSDRRGQSHLPAINDHGLINAHSDREAMQIIAHLMAERSKGSIVQASAQKTPITAAAKLQARARLQAAFQDKRSPDFAIAGETVTNTIRDTAARAGFLRRFLPERDLVVGEDPKIRLRKNETNAFSLHEMSTINESRHDGRFFYPPEVMIGSRPTITEADLYKEGFGLLEEKADEGLEIIMVSEDRGLKNLSDAAVRATNQQLAFSTFTPSVFNTLKQYVQNSGGLPVAGAWMANDLWTDVNTGNSAFSDYFSPIEKHELAMVGRIGTLQEVEIHTDAFLESRLRTLNAGELYFYAKPEFLGEILVRAHLMSSEIDGFDDGKQYRGWNIREYLAVGLANARGVSRGFRI